MQSLDSYYGFVDMSLDKGKRSGARILGKININYTFLLFSKCFYYL